MTSDEVQKLAERIIHTPDAADDKKEWVIIKLSYDEKATVIQALLAMARIGHDLPDVSNRG